MASHLMRMWRSIPLLKLKQGSTLSIRSALPKPTNVRILSGWRDDGRVEIEHFYENQLQQKKPEVVGMSIRNEEPIKTSLGRMEPLISLSLSSHPSSSEDTSSDKKDLKLIEKVIMGDGAITNSEEELAVTSTLDSNGPVADDGGGTCLTVKVPEKVNLVCDLQNGGGSISVEGKIEGDVKFSTTNGDITVTKLRGHEVDLVARSIYGRDVLEAQNLSIAAENRVRVKQVLCRGVQISVHPKEREECEEVSFQPVVQEDDADDEGSLVDISALFTGEAGATISVKGPRRPPRRAVRVKSHHGPLEVIVQGLPAPTETSTITNELYPLVELGGVNGNCEVSVKDSSTTKEDHTPSDWVSCLVHFDSLSPDSVSLLTVERGNTAITMDRKIESDIRLLSLSSPESLVDAELLVEEEDPNLLVSKIQNLSKGSVQVYDKQRRRRLSIKTASFTPRPQSINNDDAEYIDGWVENRSGEPGSRFERRVTDQWATGGGKIRLDGAAEQALKGFSKDEGEDRPATDDDGIGSTGPPLVAAVSTGDVSLETLSWSGAILRRYGLDDESGREAGRTASRKGRPIAPMKE